MDRQQLKTCVPTCPLASTEDEYMMRTSSFYQPVPTREHIRSREAAFKARRMRGSDAWVAYHRENGEVGLAL